MLEINHEKSETKIRKILVIHDTHYSSRKLQVLLRQWNILKKKPQTTSRVNFQNY